MPVTSSRRPVRTKAGKSVEKKRAAPKFRKVAGEEARLTAPLRRGPRTDRT